MVFCVKFGAKEAEGHGIVLVAAPLRLCWLLRRQERTECLFVYLDGFLSSRHLPDSS